MTTTTRRTLDQQVFLRLVRTAETKMADVAVLLKGHGLSEPQYNVLRILRAAASDGLRCRDITARMLTRVPDVTRLVDRLIAAGYVTRHRDDETDRRAVTVRITPKGRGLLARLDEPILVLHRRQFESLTHEELRTLGALLAKAEGGSR